METADPDVSSTLDPPAGERAGRYELFAEIGAGGMARVHIGRLLGAAGFARTVAVKRPLPALTRDDDFRRSASNEARLAARVHHPNVVPTIDVVEHGDELLIVMEYVHGEPLAALASAARARGQRVPLGVAAALVGGALRGLEAVHAARDERGRPLGLIHRDVSPQNILVGVDGLPRLSDFGLAKAAGQANLTGRDEFKGKLTYASPEQVALVPLSPASDLYSMGLVLWELLAGERLYAGMTAAEIVARLLAGGSVPAPSRAAAGVSALLDPVVERATRRRPDERFGSAAAMALALEQRVEPAPLGEVAAWVRALASRTLAARERLVMAAERQTTPSKRGDAAPTGPAGFAAPASEGAMMVPAGPSALGAPAGPGPRRAGQAGLAPQGRHPTLLSAQFGAPTSFELAVTMPVGPLGPSLARPGVVPGDLGATLPSPGSTSVSQPASPARAAAAASPARAAAAASPARAPAAPPVSAPFATVEGGAGPAANPSPRPSVGATLLRASGVVVGVSLAIAVAKFVAPRGPSSAALVPSASASALAPPLPSAAPPLASASASGEAPEPPATGSAAADPPAPSATGARSAPPRKKAPPETRRDGDKTEGKRDPCSPPYSIDADGIRHMKPGCQ